MRLTCPNCGAQYEVGEDVIPHSGRDVQCSSCGNTWFQKSAQSNDDLQSPATEDVETGVDEGVTETPSEPPESVAESATESQASEPAIPAPPPETPEPPAAKTGLDEGVADILRSEAERETAQRAEDDGKSANITDPIANRLDDQSASMAEQIDVDMSDAAAGTRSDLLPDIEEINSTLSADDINAADADDEMSVVATKSGFRRGFVIAVVVFAILALVYVFAREIADEIPQLASPLSSYVDWVNQLRESVDALMLKAVDKLTAILGQLNGEATG